MNTAQDEHYYQDGRFVILEGEEPPHIFIVNDSQETGEWFIPFSNVEIAPDGLRFSVELSEFGDEPITLGGFRYDASTDLHEVLPPMMLRRLKLLRENDE